jgi:hypothetical protein
MSAGKISSSVQSGKRTVAPEAEQLGAPIQGEICKTVDSWVYLRPPS